MVYLCLNKVLCKHLSKSTWRPKYYWQYTWNFLDKTWKNHGNIMEFCQSGNVGTLYLFCCVFRKALCQWYGEFWARSKVLLLYWIEVFRTVCSIRIICAIYETKSETVTFIFAKNNSVLTQCKLRSMYAIRLCQFLYRVIKLYFPIFKPIYVTKRDNPQGIKLLLPLHLLYNSL